MLRAIKWTGAIIAILVVFVAVALLLIVALFDWNRMREPVMERVSRETGRAFMIEGDLRGEISWRPLIRATDVRLGNTDWGAEPNMVEVEELLVRLDLRELLRARLVVEVVRILGADITLEVDAEGRANWHLDEALELLPGDRTEIPIAENLIVENSRLKYRDALREITFEATVASAAMVSPENGALPVSLEGTGRLRQRPISLAARGGPLARLGDSAAAYPIEADIEVGQTRARIEGRLTEPFALAGLDVDLRIAGPSPEELAQILGIPLPATPPYELVGRLIREADLWRFEDFEGIVGGSDLAGSLAVDAGMDRPLLTADLVSRRLDAEDLGPLIGLPRHPGQVIQEAGAVTPPRVLPDAPLQMEQIQQTDAEVRFRGEDVIAPGLPLRNVDLTLELKDGVLQFTPLLFGLGGGRLTLFTSIYSTVDPVETDYDLRISGVQLQSLFNEAGIGGTAEGVIEGRARFSTFGDTIRRAMATAEGDVALVMEGGHVTGSTLRLLDVGFLEALAVLLTDGQPSPMELRCMIARFHMQDGEMTPSPLLLDTADSVITGDGVIDLGQETLSLRIVGEAKDPSLAGSRLPVQIGGRFVSPSAQVDPTEAVVRGGLAAGLAALVAPLAAVIPFLEPGWAEDSPCRQLIEEAEGAVE